MALYENFVYALASREILFLVSPEAATMFDVWNLQWENVAPAYKDEMYHRVKNASRSI
uniref:Uncharacterized protein n=1 Tax=Candidatus Kentrum sp. MB TaxID=2138164 RepID=A0A451B956_9GAMM|nr:MAG: hypothetical protein BECKMB1821G_GA0114241_104429 [Candidatus Kentron sp. MB]VFK29532.1 MAG: hypothetical protein BECKMB1821I_GA0114274_101045 [Candidatus Kentron sp. MB]VFK74818.1 MAG: hypothetical protein BECKMB1821H_GA0114242_101045 [Candidatus Kentron sp. MB]